MNVSNPNPVLVERVVAAIRSVVGEGPAVLHEPSFVGNEWLYVKECLDSTFVSSVGKFVDRFERDLAAFTGARHAVAVVNGTAALHISLLLAGVEYGDEVLVPAMTFVATANAVTYCHAHPHFVDSTFRNLGVDVEKLRTYLRENTEQRSGHCVNRRTGRVIRAFVPMHTFGHPGDIDGFLALSNDFNIVLVEDAAESLGSYYHGRHTGTFGRIGTLSFNGNKTITTGGGGAILTNDSELARRAKHLTTTAKISHNWEFSHDEIGYNYRMPNINAALGCAQLERLPEFLEDKRKLHQHYRQALVEVEGVSLLAEPEGCTSNYWLQTLVLAPEFANLRDALLSATNGVAIMTRPIWTLMHRLKPFAASPRMDLSCAEDMERRILNIPSGPTLSRNLEN